MTAPKVTDRCPLCKEPIAAGATRCKHCHADLSVVPTKSKPLFAKLNTFRVGFMAGALFALTLVLLLYLQCRGE
ncbi:MAG TPA: hypothetical protein VN285_01985 [Candidatus Deferrimicrobium sp.]|nr:hypothetical protein [Candidatus Deferrimicrobium sp.]